MSDLIFHPVEQAYLADWLGQERPAAARDIQLDKWLDAEANGFIGLKSNPYEFDDPAFDSINNAVARLCLNNIQQSLPVWLSIAGDGTTTLGRSFDPVIQRPVQLVSNLIAEVNWASTAPGMDWPEAWCVTALPVFDRQ